MKLWAMYALGQATHVLKRASLSASSPQNRLQSMGAFLALTWPTMTVRIALESALFLLWREFPHVPNAVAAKLGVNLDFELPLTMATAFIYGMFSDTILDWAFQKVPFLRETMPPAV